MTRSVDKKKKFSRKRNNEDEGDITYINERNKVFNKKVRLRSVMTSGCYMFLIDVTDCTLLRQVYNGNSCKFRAWDRPMIWFLC